MARCLIALGSNLGDRAVQLQQALAGLTRLPATRLLTRSREYRTRPIGGPAGQGEFLNAAALVETSLAPSAVLAALERLEESLGRQRTERWAARTLDLDILLYDDAAINSPELTVPHPRMSYRRFVLEPAAEAASWMIHPDSAWTVGSLLDHLDHAPESVAVAALDSQAAVHFANRLAADVSLPRSEQAGAVSGRPTVQTWSAWRAAEVSQRPRLILALADLGGVDRRQLRKMLHLPPTGPIGWIDIHDARFHEEAIAAIQAVWPTIA
jgi:2-amino-4-hydroxy-6-hydroxymethyldihydropteridine diphosphokinase